MSVCCATDGVYSLASWWKKKNVTGEIRTKVTFDLPLKDNLLFVLLGFVDMDSSGSRFMGERNSS